MQFFSQPITSNTLIISTIFSIFIYGIISYINNGKLKNILITIVISLLVISGSILFASKTYDLTCDGNSYHKYAIGNLKSGWNPIYQDSYDFSVSNNLCEDTKTSLWIDHYPKATWTFAATVYAFTSDIESGKAITIIIAISLIFLLTSYLSKRYLKIWQSILVSIFIGFGPIICAQIFSYYVDGILGISIYILTMFLIMITDKKYDMNNTEKWIGLCISIILCINIKFTGLVFSGIFSFFFYVYWLYKAKKEDKLLIEFKRKTIFFAITLLVSIAFVGSSSYVKNLLDHKNPLYPLFGEGKVDIITRLQPEIFGNKTGLEKLFYSIFSETANVSYALGSSPEFKIPFTVTSQEIKNSSIPDVRIGGYGVLFSGIFLVSVVIIIFGMIKLYKNNKIEFQICSIVLISVIVSTIIMTESWWARYAPQLYIIPILALIMLFANLNFLFETKNKNYIKIIFTMLMCIFMCSTIFINTYNFVEWRIKDIELFEKVSTDMYKIKKDSQGKTMNISKPEFLGLLFNLNDQNVKFNITNVDDQNVENVYSVYNGWIKVLGDKK
jgi:hypothetical protein